MNNEVLFNSVMQKVCEREFSAFENVPRHKFSKGFDRRIEKLQNISAPKKALPLRSRTRLALIAVIAAVIALCGFATFNILFVADKSDETWVMLSGSAADAPETILRYYQPALPYGFYPDKSYNSICTDKMYTVGFTNGKYHFYFTQSTAADYKIGFEKGEVNIVSNISEDTIDVYYNSCDLVSRIWSDGEYVYEISGCTYFYESTEFKTLYEVFPQKREGLK